ncbi:transcriptional regulator, TetR family [Sphingomonas laterariae]|uniref:Transcriptional regulator, TetR family n=1 Tax=Edaphosphingomonas laterariae TaxID=861865 RepID=A0A239G394_9SPHN|nr:TetR/AcrR family transcriptional regulator [Sphingomonas laterariae]SNS63687.1 transcriptional regulator, TetR family [Sphingomonas laterariae]
MTTRPIPIDDREQISRAQILRAAGIVFLKEGFERTSVDMIAAVAHMSKQSLYAFYPNKLALFEAAVRREVGGSRHRDAVAECDQDIAATLRRYAERLFADFTDPTNFGLFRANIAAANHVPALAADLHAWRLAGSRPLGDYLERQVAAGRIVPCDALAMAIRFGGLVVGGSRLFFGYPAPAPDDRDALANTAIRLFLHGYAGAATAAERPDDIEPAPDLAPDLANIFAPPALEGTAALRLSPAKLAALVEAATAEFIDQGYRGANVERIAAAVHASKATIYRQFGNKEKLLRYAIQQDIHVAGQAALPTDAGPDLDAAITGLARAAMDEHLHPRNIRMHRLLIQEADLLPDLARRFHAGREARLGLALTAVLRHHARPAPSASDIAAFHVLATYAVRFFTDDTPVDPAVRDRYAAECARLFLHGLATGG